MSSEVERVFHAEGTHQYNLTKRQNDALDRLSTRDDVMIKDADKGVRINNIYTGSKATIEQ